MFPPACSRLRTSFQPRQDTRDAFLLLKGRDIFENVYCCFTLWHVRSVFIKTCNVTERSISKCICTKYCNKNRHKVINVFVSRIWSCLKGWSIQNRYVKIYVYVCCLTLPPSLISLMDYVCVHILFIIRQSFSAYWTFHLCYIPSGHWHSKKHAGPVQLVRFIHFIFFSEINKHGWIIPVCVFRSTEEAGEASRETSTANVSPGIRILISFSKMSNWYFPRDLIGGGRRWLKT